MSTAFWVVLGLAVAFLAQPLFSEWRTSTLRKKTTLRPPEPDASSGKSSRKAQPRVWDDSGWGDA